MIGVLRGLGVTFSHFMRTYVDDVRLHGKRYFTREGVEYRSSSSVQGVFTIQYPEEKYQVPPAFRDLPILIYDEATDQSEEKLRCTACGICAKACPPQCIWIERKSDPATKRPIPQPAAFFIDIDICMNCGFCAEFCPFDAIKMDRNYELAGYDRSDHLYDLKKLARPASYEASIHPPAASRQETIEDS